MADQNIVTNIVATADFSSLITDINRATTSLANLQQQLNTSNKTLAVQAAKISSTFAETLRSTGQFSTHFVSLSSDVDRFGKNLDGGKLKLKQYFQTFQEHTKTSGGLIRQLAQQQVAMQNAILQPLGKNAQGLMQFNVQVPQGLDTIKNKTAIARQELQILNKVVQDGGVQLINWGKNTQWAGRQLTVGLTLPLAAFGKAAADAFAQADAELVRLTKVYGGLAQTSARELGQVRTDVSNTAKDIASAYGVSFKETIALAADIAATGKTGNELLGSIKETSRLSVLGEVDRQEAMKATLAIQSGFKQNTDELSKSINFLNAVENQTSTTLSDLVEAIPKAGPVVKSLGGSIQDLALYLTAMKEGGINASEGANAIKSSLASLINPTKVAKEMFAGFGIDLSGIVTQNAGDLTGTIVELQKALETLDPLSKSKAIEQLFGKFQFARMSALFENLGKQGSQTLQVMDLMKASSEDLAAVAGRELSQVTESASGKYRRALEGLKADLAGVGEQFLNLQTFFINLTDKVIGFINKLPDPIQKILTAIGGLTAIAGPLIMLTGVLANFFGYIIKGVAHFKALFRGGEGWKLLTPEILAAEKAGSMMETTMYSDAKAASILELALKNLNTELTILQAKASSNSISVKPVLSAVANAGRQVDPNHPLLSPEDTRSMSHMSPVAGMTEQQKYSQTLFGVVPGAPKVNQKISNNPQMYMEGDLPKIPGVTSINGVSTGVVASEAAKWHAMTGAIAMQSEAEIQKLKAQVSATGLITSELSVSYEALLPEMTKLTSMAAQEASSIVAELQAGKITVDAARAKIIALNANVEAMMAETATAVAASQGRSINLTKVPLVDQPIVGPTGKSNLKELTRPGRTRDLLNKIARNLNVKTFGAGYSTETTIPKRLAMGGWVPGQGEGDTVPAMLTPGEFVVNKDAAQANMGLLMNINGGQQATGPGMAVGGVVASKFAPFAQGFLQQASMIGGVRKVGTRSVRSLQGGSDSRMPYEQMRSIESGRGNFWKKSPLLLEGMPRGRGQVVGHLYGPQFTRMYGSGAKGSSPRLTREQLAAQGLSVNSSANLFDVLPNNVMTFGRSFNTQLNKGTATAASWMASGARPEHLIGLTSYLLSNKIPPTNIVAVRQRVLNNVNAKMARIPGNINERQFGGLVTNAIRQELTTISRHGWPSATPRPSYTGSYKNRRTMNRGGVAHMAGGGLVRSLVGGAAISMGGQYLGNAIGGGMGQAVSMGSSMLGMGFGFGGMGGGQNEDGSARAGFMSRQMSKLPDSFSKTIGPAAKFESALAKSSMGGTRLASTLGRVALGLTRMNVAIGLGTGAIMLGIKLWKDHNEALRINALGYGLTAEAAQKAGLKYTDYNKRMKDAIENAKALRERNNMLYESMASSGTPLKMTIEQYKKLKEQVKSTMGDYIKLFDQTNRKDVGQVATQLKAQFMAAGDSAETATAKIYTLIEQSNKAGSAASSISGQAFIGIKNLSDAAAQTAKTFEASVQVGDAKSQAQALLTSFQAIDSAIDETVKKSEDASKKTKKDAITYGEAAKQQIDSVNASTKTQQTLSRSVIAELGKQNPELAKVLNSTDTLTSAWSKYQLVLKGVNVDLKTMSGEAASAALTVANTISTTATSMLKSTILSGQYAQLKTYKDQIAAMVTASKGQTVKQQIDTKARIKEINKEIDAINKAADAKIKALRKTSEAENAKIDIQKAQLDYQAAIARGDRDAAAQAQLTIQQITNDAQQKAAEDKITTNAEKQIAPLQAELDKINNAQEAMGNKAALAAESLGSLQAKAATLVEKINSVNDAFANILMNRLFDPNYAGSPQEVKDLTTAGAKAKAAGATVPTPTWQGIPYKVPTQADAVDNILKPIATALSTKGINMGTGDVIINGKKVDMTPVQTTSASTTGQSMNAGINIYKAGGTIEKIGSITYIYDNLGRKYDVTSAAGIKLKKVFTKVPPKANGGSVLGNSPYLVGENGPELFVPGMNGSILPNNITGPRFNIPTGNITGMSGGNTNGSSNSNMYNINIELNGTNVTADDIMRKFKQELSLINAKEGPSRTFGGRP